MTSTPKIEPVVESTFTTCMEQLQEGYVAGVAATAGCLFNPVRRDYYGMDVLLVRPGDVDQEEIAVYAQLKNTTTIKPDPEKSHFSFRFKHRDQMQRLANRRGGIKAILIVMATHPQQSLWTRGTHDELTLLHCCYWVSLEGQTVRPEVESPTVKVPTANRFTAEALMSILDRLDRGEAL